MSEIVELPQIASVADIASYLGISEERVYRMVRHGDPPLPHVRVGWRIVVPRAAFLRWLEGRHADEES